MLDDFLITIQRARLQVAFFNVQPSMQQLLHGQIAARFRHAPRQFAIRQGMARIERAHIDAMQNRRSMVSGSLQVKGGGLKLKPLSATFTIVVEVDLDRCL